MPDFDVDFCMEKRDQVIEHVAAAVTGEGVLMTSALLWASATSGVNG